MPHDRYLGVLNVEFETSYTKVKEKVDFKALKCFFTALSFNWDDIFVTEGLNLLKAY